MHDEHLHCSVYSSLISVYRSSCGSFRDESLKGTCCWLFRKNSTAMWEMNCRNHKNTNPRSNHSFSSGGTSAILQSPTFGTARKYCCRMRVIITHLEQDSEKKIECRLRVKSKDKNLDY